LSASATLMYVSESSNSVGVAQLRQNLSVYLRRVEMGERLVVTDRNRPVATLNPIARRGSRVDQLIAEGRARPPKRKGPLPKPLDLGDDTVSISRALEEVRGYR